MIVFLVILVIVEYEVQDTDGIDSLQPEQPLSLFPLRTDGERRVVHAAILEPGLVSLLHLNDDLVALFVLAVDVEYGTAVVLRVTELFSGDEGERADVLTPLQQGIDQLQGVLLVGLRTEEVLETVVGVGVDVASTHFVFSFLGILVICAHT